MRRFATLAFLSMLAAVLMVFRPLRLWRQDQRVSIRRNKSFEQTVDSFKAAVSKERHDGHEYRRSGQSAEDDGLADEGNAVPCR